MWSKNGVPAALKIIGSTELAYYVQRNNDLIVYRHGNSIFAVNLKDTLEKLHRNN